MGLTYQQLVDRLRARTDIPLLAGEVWDAELQTALAAATPESLFPGCSIADPGALGGVAVGLRIWNDDFVGAHNLAQGLEDSTGSYWHGICHRREGHRGEGLASNLGNAKYWFRRTGGHPAFGAVYQALEGVLDGAGSGFRWASEAQAMLRQRGGWDPQILTDWVAEAERGVLSTPTAELLKEMQRREIATLTDWCAQRAVGR